MPKLPSLPAPTVSKVPPPVFVDPNLITQPRVPVTFPKRIGVVLGNLKGVNIPALKYLVVQLNSRQDVFEFEVLGCDVQDPLIQALSREEPIDKETVRAEIAAFLNRFRLYSESLIQRMKLKEALPDYFVLVTMAQFVDEYYTMRQGSMSIVALGNWKRKMAPPSILEFIITLLIREGVAAVSPSLRGSVHLGTKGCLCDFTLHLEDARFKVLQGFVCSHCRDALASDGHANLAEELSAVLDKTWLGKTSDPSAPAGIVSNLGFDLFLTKGLKPTKWESFLGNIQQEGVKELLKLIGGVVLAGLLLWLGLKK